MSDKTELGDRMKMYEDVSRIKLTRRMPMIIRVDGKAFHTYARSFEKPWDSTLVNGMNAIAHALMREVQGAKLAYVQSDEVSVLVTDYDKVGTSAWFDKNVQKICSVAASIATAIFNNHMYDTYSHLDVRSFQLAHLDARCFVVPEAEVCNYMIWRQADATRNSIMGLAQKHFSHKQLHGVNTGQAQEMLFKEHNINWDDCETWQKRGWCVTRKLKFLGQNGEIIPECTEAYNNPDVSVRAIIESDWNIPIFTQDRNYVESRLPSW